MRLHLVPWGDCLAYGDNIPAGSKRSPHPVIISEAARRTKYSAQIRLQSEQHVSTIYPRKQAARKQIQACGKEFNQEFAASVPRPRVWWLGRKRSAALYDGATGGMNAGILLAHESSRQRRCAGNLYKFTSVA
jgi:hypothetical protein